MKFFLTLLAIGFINCGFTSERNKLSDSLILEQSIVNADVIQFKNDEKLYPESSSFKIVHSVTMSNERGERWATITLQNQAAGRRILKREHIMAVFANGIRKFPTLEEYTLESNEIQSISMYFGKNKFPILKLFTRE